jgi:uncharacterized LabA/DUF88 family protein
MATVLTTTRKFKIKESVENIQDSDGWLFLTELVPYTKVQRTQDTYTKFENVTLYKELKVIVNKAFAIEIVDDII